jgi:hypothetical protein
MSLTRRVTPVARMVTLSQASTAACPAFTSATTASGRAEALGAAHALRRTAVRDGQAGRYSRVKRRSRARSAEAQHEQADLRRRGRGWRRVRLRRC